MYPHLNHLEEIRYPPYDFDPIWPKATAPSGASIGSWPPSGFEFMGKKNWTDDVKARMQAPATSKSQE